MASKQVKPVAPRLTSLAACAGCAAKLRPDLLSAALTSISQRRDTNALVGFETSDDAAVYRLSPTQAVVETVDFFPPIHDDPFVYGQIAAANAMSDIWAMGAKALFALNVVAFPKELPIEILHQILKGGAAKAQEAGIPILGGHTIQSTEPKYGLAVTGVVHPRRVLKNSGAKANDVLVLTKPLGTGIATTAMKRDVDIGPLAKLVTEQMATLNKAAGEVFAKHFGDVHALTDVTGFGLLGHLLEMARGSKVHALLELERVPLLPGIAQLAEADIVPGGTKTNLEHVEGSVHFPEGLPLPIKHVLSDAQTNGGLLAAVSPKALVKVMRALEKAKVEAYVIGGVVRGPAGISVG